MVALAGFMFQTLANVIIGPTTSAVVPLACAVLVVHGLYKHKDGNNL